MGGVDRANENTEKYRASIRGKKLYSSPLLFCFELVLQNAWQLHKTFDEKLMDFLEFSLCVVCYYLETHGHPQNLAEEKELLRSVTLTHVMMA
jgi:DNA excision repair protein ERCC-6